MKPIRITFLALTFSFFIFFSSFAIAAKIEYRIPIYCNTNSMGTTLDCHDTVYFTVVLSGDKLKVGEIYAYRPQYDRWPGLVPGDWILHRLVAINGTQLTFKGDNNPSEDPVVTRQYVNFKVSRIIKSK